MSRFSTFTGAIRSHLGGPRNHDDAKPFNIKASIIETTPDLATGTAGLIQKAGIIPAGAILIGYTVHAASAAAGTIDVKARHISTAATLDVLVADLNTNSAGRTDLTGQSASTEDRVIELTTKTGTATQTATIELEIMQLTNAQVAHWPYVS